ncbi:unnamed protein product [Protopolystoma xenopodis]|uniref:Uncharacterized protein n=1 Tax=Protopolystoma xenopodis TaxID=117903 RepID=A0A448WV29_9PLAT|nr:unnamed protein product [Protopolystoma xenopodis]
MSSFLRAFTSIFYTCPDANRSAMAVGLCIIFLVVLPTFFGCLYYHLCRRGAGIVSVPITVELDSRPHSHTIKETSGLVSLISCLRRIGVIFCAICSCPEQMPMIPTANGLQKPIIPLPDFLSRLLDKR